MTRRARKPTGVYARLYVTMLRNAKVVERSDLAYRLYVNSILWCRDEGNDGFVPDSALIACVPGRTKSKLLAAAQELVAAGLWIVDYQGHLIHDYLDRQDGAEKIEANRNRARVAAGSRWGDEPEP